MASKHLKTIHLVGGNEINLYSDDDGYHAEHWNQSRQCITIQGGDCATEEEALEAAGYDPGLAVAR